MPPTTTSMFFNGADAIELFLKIEDPKFEDGSVAVSTGRDRQSRVQPRSALIALHPMFSHTAFRLIEMLSITQHGEFSTSSKKGNHQTIVEVGGHVCQRHFLTEADLVAVQHLYQHILDAQFKRWQQSRDRP